ncbi:MAG TPA: hypothetical protein VFD59_16460 [Nocardioidaceae bacterium]|nr:hypothetical protein [Nocardioidaceae bacterium]
MSDEVDPRDDRSLEQWPCGDDGTLKPYANRIVTFRVLLGGYEQAVERFGEASRTRDPVRVFAPLFEALNWAVVLDDQAREHWAPEGVPLGWSWRTRVEGGDFVSAIGFVRNRVHHQWADALTLSDGFSSPLVAPLVSHEWRSRRLVDLPGADTPGAKNAADAAADYEHLLATKPARLALAVLFVPFRRLADMLEPLSLDPWRDGPGRS